jgi:dihydrofolate synthase/folylpolyglutamate synthase
VEAIAPLFKKFAKVTLTLPGSVKKADPQRMRAAFADAGIPFAYNADYVQAVAAALSRAERKKIPLLVTGSFYLAGEAKRVINEQLC